MRRLTRPLILLFVLTFLSVDARTQGPWALSGSLTQHWSRLAAPKEQSCELVAPQRGHTWRLCPVAQDNWTPTGVRWNGSHKPAWKLYKDEKGLVVAVPFQWKRVRWQEALARSKRMVALQIGATLFEFGSARYAAHRGGAQGNPILGNSPGRQLGILSAAALWSTVGVVKEHRDALEDEINGAPRISRPWWAVGLIFPAAEITAGTLNFARFAGKPVVPEKALQAARARLAPAH